MNTVIDTILKRRSIRGFTPQQITDSDLQIILECALNAPSACDKQSWHFTVTQNADTIVYLNDTAKTNLRKSDVPLFREFGEDETIALLYGAPTLIIVSGDDTDYDSIINCSAAVQNMLIAAQSLGLGTLWNGLINFAFETPDARQMCRIPDGFTSFFGIAIGYADPSVALTPKEVLRDGVIDFID